MQRLRDMFIDGLLLAVPLFVIGYILVRIVLLLEELATPIARRLPEFPFLSIVLAVAILLLCLIALGGFAMSSTGRDISRWLERVVLRKIPGFVIYKSMAAGFSKGHHEDCLVPALVTFDDNVVLGFIVESGVTSEQLLTVFVPSAPTPAAGTVFLMPRDRVRVLDVPVTRAMATVTRLGLGLKDLLPAEGGTRRPAP